MTERLYRSQRGPQIKFSVKVGRGLKKVGKHCSRPVLVNRVYRTPQGVPGFSRGVPPRWGVQGCTTYVASHSIFFALVQCANLSQALKSYIGECELSLFSRLFVMLVK